MAWFDEQVDVWQPAFDLKERWQSMVGSVERSSMLAVLKES
jgi:hypothetical protein